MKSPFPSTGHLLQRKQLAAHDDSCPAVCRQALASQGFQVGVGEIGLQLLPGFGQHGRGFFGLFFLDILQLDGQLIIDADTRPLQEQQVKVAAADGASLRRKKRLAP